MKGKHEKGVGGAGEEVWKEGTGGWVGLSGGSACERAGKEYRRREMLSGVVQSSHRI